MLFIGDTEACRTVKPSRVQGPRSPLAIALDVAEDPPHVTRACGDPTSIPDLGPPQLS
jgi:hypothetical protein